MRSRAIEMFLAVGLATTVAACGGNQGVEGGGENVAPPQTAPTQPVEGGEGGEGDDTQNQPANEGGEGGEGGES